MAGKAWFLCPMIDIKKHIETELNPTIRTKILRILSIGETTIGVLVSRLKNHDRDLVLDDLQKLQDEGLVTVTPYMRRGQRTLIIKRVDKA